MLVKYSPVLRRMLVDSPSKETYSGTYSGVPIVKMKDDKDDAVFALLKALYNRNFRDSLETLEFRSKPLLLEIGIKYESQEIRGDLERYLETLFPNTLKQYKNSKLKSTRIYAKDAFSVLAIAVSANFVTILPALHYHCANYPINDIGRNFHLLPAKCVPGFLNGRDWMTKMSFYLLMKVLQYDWGVDGNEEMCANKQCMKQCREQLNKNYNFESEECPTSILDVPDRGALVFLEAEESKVCKICEEDYLVCVRNAKTGFWNSLPSLFYLGTWDDPRAP